MEAARMRKLRISSGAPEHTVWSEVRAIDAKPLLIASFQDKAMLSCNVGFIVGEVMEILRYCTVSPARTRLTKVRARQKALKDSLRSLFELTGAVPARENTWCRYLKRRRAGYRDCTRRGEPDDSHVIACCETGISSETAHVLKRPAYSLFIPRQILRTS